ncbi:uncharacterized protein LOC143242983 [Tachypleus tridentatus]|uniref:uncharacterized protein LOC143242983 n=1 Tax=Tachypleus tridentatus TaxID=6853 RepID=UPI003FD34357
MITASEKLCPKAVRKLQTVALNHMTVQRRISHLSADVTRQLTNKAANLVYNLDGDAVERGSDDETTFLSVIKTVSEDPGVKVSRLLPTKYLPEARPSPHVNYPVHHLDASNNNEQ